MAGMVSAWPRLREELRLYPGPSGNQGEPSWTLHDPSAQRFFRLGWLEMEILNRWGLGHPEAIARSIAMETTLSPHPARVDMVRNFLVANNLVVASTEQDTARLAGQRYGKKKSLLMAAFKNYLFIRLPLVRPDRFLQATVSWIHPFFTTSAAFVVALAALLGLYGISRQWADFRDSFASLLTVGGGLMALVTLGCTKIAHELGHAYACTLLGLRVPSMGFSLMCFAPVLWTDTTEAWRIADRKKRLFIGVAGVYSEIALAAVAALLWPVLPPGALKTVAFITAGSAWIVTLTVNINPCMRYDGYYLLSDYWNLPGLQTRSFALAKWWLRERLFGFGLPAPERFSRWDRAKLIVYAFLTWVYRFFLFMGIALMVYHLFFKALGAVLMLVELVFFIALPVMAEVGKWVSMRKHFRFNHRLVLTGGLFAVAVLFLAWPWHSRVDGAGLLFAERQAFFYARTGAVMETVHVENGSPVRKDDLLFSLHSPDLESRIVIASHKLVLQRSKLSLASLDARLRAEMAADWEELERLAEDLAGLLARRNELRITAPWDGTVMDIPAWITPGSWVAANEGLGMVTGGSGMVTAYVSEADWSRIGVDGNGVFYPSGNGWDPVPLTITVVDNQAVTEIAYPELASVSGGPLPVHRSAEGRMVPENAVYKVLCRTDGTLFGNRLLTGVVSLDAKPRSLIALVWNNFIGLLIRESGW